MSDAAALAGFIDKWRARWPEWGVAEVFLPSAMRESTLAWLALRQELADAAWGGADPIPGAAKLAWWSEELHGWAQGRRRHPLGQALQRVAAPWDGLSRALPALAVARDIAPSANGGVDRLREALAPFAEVAAAVSAAIAREPAPTRDAAGNAIAAAMLAARATAGAVDPAGVRAVMDAWPRQPAGVRADRIQAALARLRLQAGASRASGGAAEPAAPSRWRTLLAAWHAGRTIPHP